MKKFDKVQSLYDSIERGREGLNIGISTGLPKLDNIIGGIQRQTFYLIAGGTGSGKTTLCLYSFVYQPLKENLGNDKFRVVYYSLEMTAEMLYAKLMSMWIYDEYQVQVSYGQIFSRQEVLSDELYNYVLLARKWLEKVQEHLVIYDKALTTNTLYAHLKTYSEENGTYVESETGHNTEYVPHVKEQLVLVVIDHVWLMRSLANQTKKDMVDLAAEYLVYFRNKCGYSPIPLQQLNRQGSGMDRRKEGMQLPELQDLKGTGGVAEAAEIVIALFNPVKEKMSTWEGYPIRTLRDKFRAVCVLKNRFGDSDRVVPTSFFGNVNIFREMPLACDIKDFEKYTDINYTPDNQEDKDDDEPDSSSPMFVL